ncbi:MAG: hypothetical protein IID37_00615 [Planctomycetes bacterium]|nr:hypothetical protein [Planctomycetota bacterium]
MGSVFVFGLIATVVGGRWIELPASVAQSISPAGYMKVVLLIVGLFMVFVLGGFILIRSSRRYRERLLRRPPPPTPSVDIWKMHRLPDDVESEFESDDPPADAGSEE